MPRNKPRLEIGLYARPKHPGTYHYALFISPKDGIGGCTKYHVKNTLQVDQSGTASQPWRFEEAVIPDIDTEQRLLVRVVIAKTLKDCDSVRRILEIVPIYQVDHPETVKAQEFTCRTWVRDAFRSLIAEGAVTGQLGSWENAERKAVEYLDMKRKQGRWDTSTSTTRVPLMDLLSGQEVVE